RVVRSPTAAIGSYREGGAGTPAAESILENGAAVTHWTNHFLGRRCQGHVGSRSGPRRGASATHWTNHVHAQGWARHPGRRAGPRPAGPRPPIGLTTSTPRCRTR